MPIHDWTRVDAGMCHDFHVGWVAELRRVLNQRLLPPDHYAEVEPQRPARAGLVLELGDDADGRPRSNAPVDGDPWPEPPERPRLAVELDASDAYVYALKRRSVAVRCVDGDRLVALIELASPGNKDRAASVEAFVGKAIAALSARVHLAVLDLFPPRRSDGPGGLVGAVAAEAGIGFELPAGKPLCVGAFEADPPAHLSAEPLGVGDAPPDLPLFYAPGRFVLLPLAATYDAAYAATPRRWRDVVEGRAGA